MRRSAADGEPAFGGREGNGCINRHATLGSKMVLHAVEADPALLVAAHVADGATDADGKNVDGRLPFS